MSLLPNSTNVNENLTFFGAGGGGLGIGTVCIPYPTNVLLVVNLPPGNFVYFPLSNPLVEFPYNTQMTVTINFIFDSNINFDEFTVGMEQDGVVSVSSTVDLHNQKGVFGVSLVGYFTNPANTPINIRGFIQNTTSSGTNLTVPTKMGFTNIVVFVPP